VPISNPGSARHHATRPIRVQHTPASAPTARWGRCDAYSATDGLLEAIRRTHAIDGTGPLNMADRHFLPLESGYLLALPSAPPGLVFLPRQGHEVHTLCAGIEVSSICLSGGIILATEGAEGPRGQEVGSILVMDPTEQPPALRKRIRLPFAIKAACRTPEGDGYIALATSSVLRVDPAGQFRVLYGVAGFQLPPETSRVSWRDIRPNSIAQVGEDCLIGAEFGVIWLAWNAGAHWFEEYLMVPADIAPLLLEVRGIQQLPPAP
jgi:hypothetical protein